MGDDFTGSFIQRLNPLNSDAFNYWKFYITGSRNGPFNEFIKLGKNRVEQML